MKEIDGTLKELYRLLGDIHITLTVTSEGSQILAVYSYAGVSDDDDDDDGGAGSSSLVQLPKKKPESIQSIRPLLRKLQYIG